MLILALLWPAWGNAQQIDVYAGGMKSLGQASESSYAWGFAYAQPITNHIAASFSWLNEGHVTNHHRDGFSVQVWAHQSLLNGLADVGVGIGPYRYFDTVAAGPNRAYDNHHGYGVMSSVYLTWYFTREWSTSLRANWVHTGSSIDTLSYVVGLGYRFNRGAGEEHSRWPNTSSGRNTVTALGGLSVVNSLNSQNSKAFSFEYRRAIADWLDGTVALVAEGGNDIGHRQGVTAQLWLRHGFFRDRLALALGIGPYITWTRYDQNPEAAGRQNVVAGMLTMSGSYELSRRWTMRASWARVVSGFDRDSDIFLAGVGYRF